MAKQYSLTQTMGLVLTDEKTEDFVKRYREKHGVDIYDDADVYDTIWNMNQENNHRNGIYVGGDVAACRVFASFLNDKDGERDINLDGMDAFVLCLETDRIYDCLNPPYKSLEDAAAGLKRLYHEFLPDDFDYESHIAEFEVLWCC